MESPKKPKGWERGGFGDGIPKKPSKNCEKVDLGMDLGTGSPKKHQKDGKGGFRDGHPKNTKNWEKGGFRDGILP